MANRVVMGELPGGGIGLRVSRPGINVLSTGLNPNQLAFDSAWPNTMRVVTSGNRSIGSAPGSVTVNYGESVSGIPNVFLMVRSGSEWRPFDFDQIAGYRSDVQISEVIPGVWNVTNANNWLDPTNHNNAGLRVFSNRFEFSYTLGSIAEISYVVATDG